jgi:hypothetical protein
VQKSDFACAFGSCCVCARSVSLASFLDLRSCSRFPVRFGLSDRSQLPTEFFSCPSFGSFVSRAEVLPSSSSICALGRPRPGFVTAGCPRLTPTRFPGPVLRLRFFSPAGGSAPPAFRLCRRSSSQIFLSCKQERAAEEISLPARSLPGAESSL